MKKQYLEESKMDRDLVESLKKERVLALDDAETTAHVYEIQTLEYKPEESYYFLQSTQIIDAVALKSVLMSFARWLYDHCSNSKELMEEAIPEREILACVLDSLLKILC